MTSKFSEVSDSLVLVRIVVDYKKHSVRIVNVYANIMSM